MMILTQAGTGSSRPPTQPPTTTRSGTIGPSSVLSPSRASSNVGRFFRFHRANKKDETPVGQSVELQTSSWRRPASSKWSRAVPAHGQDGERGYRQRPPFKIAHELSGDEARVGKPAINMRRELFELAGEQTGKARLKPFRPLDHEQIVDHLHDTHAGPGLKPEQRRDVLPLPPEIARVEQDVTGAGKQCWLQRLERPWPAAREKPLDHGVEAKLSKQDIGSMIIARVSEQRPKACQAHALSKNSAQTGNCRDATVGPIEIGQKIRIDTVEGITTQHPRHEFHLGGVALRKRRDQLLRHALDAGRMAEIGVPVNDSGYVKQDFPRALLSAITVVAIGRWLRVQGQISDRGMRSSVPAFLPSIRLSVNRWRLQPQSLSPNAFNASQR